MVLAFGHPENALIKKEFTPRIDYWRHRTSKNVDVFFLGFEDGGKSFSPELFDASRRYVQGCTKWRYSGETDFVILNAELQNKEGKDTVVLDFSQAVYFSMEQLIRDKGTPNLSSYLESLVQFVDDYQGEDPLWDYSDAMGARITKNGIMKLLLRLIPSEVREQAKVAFHYAVK